MKEPQYTQNHIYYYKRTVVSNGMLQWHVMWELVCDIVHSFSHVIKNLKVSLALVSGVRSLFVTVSDAW